ncbi:MAG: protease pro-enzyme activation domain-containing protein [Planctomycetota bacterium]
MAGVKVVGTQQGNSRSMGWAWIAAILLLCANVFTAAEERVVLTNSVRPLPADVAVRSVVTTADTASTMEFMIALKMRDLTGLQARVAAGETMSAAEMKENYHPLESDYKAVETWLTQNGFSITQTDPNCMGIWANGSVGSVQNAFATAFAKVAANGRTYLSAATAPSLPASIAKPVVGINGLQPHLQKRVHSQIVPAAQSVQMASRQNNGAPFYPIEILKAYGASNLTVTGSGQQIGIVIDAAPKTSDLTQFWNTTGVTQSLSNVSFIQVVASSTPPTGEESLDTEWASSIAPGAKVRVYLTKDLADIHLDAAYQRIINDYPTQAGLNQISLSFGGNELDTSNAQMDTDAQYYLTMAGLGITVFASSGDGGSKPDRFNAPQLSSPANDTNVTSVGGTSLVLNTNTGNVSSETVWSGSGGGISGYFSRPSWQKGTGVPAGTFRLNPDVAAPANPNTGALVVLNGQSLTIGGTSWSAPTWAGICALINEARSKASMPPVGVLGPSVYPLIGTSSFRDITSGSNGDYSATVGYDLCTGIGVPNVGNLIVALTSVNGPNAPTITGFTPSTGPVGTTVTIVGTKFTSPLIVKFNGVIAQGIFTETTAVYQVPFGATTGPITITNSDGTATSFTNFTVSVGDVSALPNLAVYKGVGWSDRVIVSSSQNTTTDSTLTTTDTLYVGFSVANIGTVAINSAVSVDVFVDGSKVTTVALTNPFSANTTQSKSNISIGSLAQGPHTILVKLDPAFAISETSESDNNYTKTITVVPPPPSASIVTTNATADANALTTGSFTVTISSIQTTDVAVNFTLGGTASSGADYMSIGVSATILAGSMTATILVTPKFNSFSSASKSLTVTLTTGSGYVVGAPDSASVTILNIPPPLVVVSSPFAAPNPATAGETVSFNTLVSTLTGNTVNYTWDFKDGTTGHGAFVTHKFSAPGTYDVVVSATDGLLSKMGMITITVTAAPMTITSTALKFMFTSGRDSLTINGTLPMGSGYSPAGDTVSVTIGGYQTSFLLSSKGAGKRTGASFVLKGKNRFGFFTDSTLGFQLKLTNQDLITALNPNPGFDQFTSNPSVVLPILFDFPSTAFVASPILFYTTNGKAGSAKK